MKVPAEKITDMLDLIEAKWKVGPTCVQKSIGYSRQAIHAWMRNGASEKQYARLKNFLETGPAPDEAHPLQGDQFVITLNLRFDVTKPTDAARVAVAKAISLLQSISERWAE